MKQIEIHQILAKKFSIWFLARYKSSEFSPHKHVPGWTGFYHQVLTSTHDNNHPSKMFYFPSTAQPPTKIRTVQNVLYQVKEKVDTLKNKEANLVPDHVK